MEEEIDWSVKNVPRSLRFGDLYFSDLDGLDETKYVFLNGNKLPEIWRCTDRFIIAETGFGTGLNFFATWQLWRETSSPNSNLIYYSIEKYPLTISQIVQSINYWSDLKPLLEEFKKDYASTEVNSQTILFDKGSVTLKLIFGDVRNVLSQATFSSDAWFLDGFAPSCNPEMWSDKVFREVARLSKKGTRLATFTSASAVRRGLTDVGFDMVKIPGFGRKREMLIGHFL